MREAGRGSCERTSGGGTGHFGHRDAALGGEVVREFRDTRYVRLWYNQRVAAPQWHDVCVVGTTSIQGWTTERMLESQPDYVRARRGGGQPNIARIMSFSYRVYDGASARTMRQKGQSGAVFQDAGRARVSWAFKTKEVIFIACSCWRDCAGPAGRRAGRLGRGRWRALGRFRAEDVPRKGAAVG